MWISRSLCRYILILFEVEREVIGILFKKNSFSVVFFFLLAIGQPEISMED